MKILKKVDRIEVKRCFVASQRGRGGPDKRHVPDFTKEEFVRMWSRTRKYIKKLSGKQLDRIITKEYERRLKAYDDAEWYLGIIPIAEVGVWNRAGGLPFSWTKGSLKETASRVKHALEKGGRMRALKAVPRILNTSIDFVQKDPYLLPIVFSGGTGTQGRKGLKKMKWDMDDGCIRSLALAVSGKKTIRAYIGLENKKNKK